MRPSDKQLRHMPRLVVFLLTILGILLIAKLFFSPKKLPPMKKLEMERVAMVSAIAGKTIRVISCPRFGDGADGFAGWEGVVEPLMDGDSIAIVRQENGKANGELIIPSIYMKRLKYEIIA